MPKKGEEREREATLGRRGKERGGRGREAYHLGCRFGGGGRERGWRMRRGDDGGGGGVREREARQGGSRESGARSEG